MWSTLLPISLFGLFGLVIFLTWINGIQYLRSVKQLVAYLKDQKPEEIDRWDLPQSVDDISVRSTRDLDAYLRAQEDLSDETIMRLKTRALKHRNRGYVLFGIGAICILFLFLLEGTG